MIQLNNDELSLIVVALRHSSARYQHLRDSNEEFIENGVFDTYIRRMMENLDDLANKIDETLQQPEKG